MNFIPIFYEKNHLRPLEGVRSCIEHEVIRNHDEIALCDRDWLQFHFLILENNFVLSNDLTALHQ